MGHPHCLIVQLLPFCAAARRNRIGLYIINSAVVLLWRDGTDICWLP